MLIINSATINKIMDSVVKCYILIIFFICQLIPRTLPIKLKHLSVWGGLGGSVKLPCPLNPLVHGEHPVLTLWFRGSSTEAIYSFDSRNTQFPSGIHWSDEVILGRRAKFTTENSVPYLTLKPVLKEDHAIFTCRVDYKISPSTQVKVNLSVAIPPGLPEVYLRGQKVPSSIGPLDENEHLDLTCRTKGGFPNPTVTWWQQGRLIDTNIIEEDDGTSASSSITIVASRDMHDVPFVCHARSQHPDQSLSRPKTTAVTLNIKLPPLTVNIYGAKGPTAEGMAINPYCRSTGSHPPAKLSWFLDGRRLSQVNRSIQENGNVSSATVTLTLSKADNGRRLSCHSINPIMIEEDPLIDSVLLNVFYKPIVKLRLGKSLNSSNLKEGQDAFFDCHVSANPPQHRLEWFLNGRSITRQSQGVIVSGSSLALQKLKKKHSGTYTCSAENLEGEVLSNEVNLSIKYSPKCAYEYQQRTQGASKGRFTTLLCHVDALPTTNLTFAWTHLLPTGEEVPLSMQNITNRETVSKLSIFLRRFNDFGPYLCKATNSIGTQKDPCRILLVTEGPPEPLVNCSSNSFKDALTISCRKGFHGGFPQKFLLQAWQKEVLVANITNDFPEWTLQELKTDETIKLKLQSLNSKGASDSLQFEVHSPVANLQATTESTDDVGNFSLLAGILMGVLTVVICFLGLIVFAIHKSKSRIKSSIPATSQKLLHQQHSTHTARATSQEVTTSEETDGLSLDSANSYSSSLDTTMPVVQHRSDSSRASLPPKHFSKSVPNSLSTNPFSSLNRRDVKTRKLKSRKSSSNLDLKGDVRLLREHQLFLQQQKDASKFKVDKCCEPTLIAGEIKKRDSFHLIDYPSTPQLNRTNSKMQMVAPLAVEEVSDCHHEFQDPRTNSTRENREYRNKMFHDSRTLENLARSLGIRKNNMCECGQPSNLCNHSSDLMFALSHEQLYSCPQDPPFTGVSHFNRNSGSQHHYSEADRLRQYPKLSHQGSKSERHNIMSSNEIKKVISDENREVIVDVGSEVPNRNGLKNTSSTTRVMNVDQRESMV